MRPGELFVKLASQFDSEIAVINGDQRVDGKSLLDIFSLAAGKGTELEIEASGPDAEAALDALTELASRESFGDERESVDEETVDQ